MKAEEPDALVPSPENDLKTKSYQQCGKKWEKMVESGNKFFIFTF
jgi:hypothetical protein